MDESYCRTRSLRLVSQFGLTDTWVVRAFRPASRAFLEPWSPVGAAQENECVVPTALGVLGAVTAGLKARTTRKYLLGQDKLRHFFAIPHLVSLSHIPVPALCLRATMNP